MCTLNGLQTIIPNKKDLNQALEDALKSGNWLLVQMTLACGANRAHEVTARIGKDAMRGNWETVKSLLTGGFGVKTEITQDALNEALTMDAPVLQELLKVFKRDTPHEECKERLIKLAQDCVDTERVDCMTIILQHGVDPKAINCKECRPGSKMYKFMEQAGAYMLPY